MARPPLPTVQQHSLCRNTAPTAVSPRRRASSWAGRLHPRPPTHRTQRCVGRRRHATRTFGVGTHTWRLHTRRQPRSGCRASLLVSATLGRGPRPRRSRRHLPRRQGRRHICLRRAGRPLPRGRCHRPHSHCATALGSRRCLIRLAGSGVASGHAHTRCGSPRSCHVHQPSRRGRRDATRRFAGRGGKLSGWSHAA